MQAGGASNRPISLQPFGQWSLRAVCCVTALVDSRAIHCAPRLASHPAKIAARPLGDRKHVLSPGRGAMAGGLPLAKNSGHSAKRLGCGGCRSVLSNCGARAMEILEKARPATNANKAGPWRHHCGRVESNVTDSRSAKPKRPRLEHSSHGRDDQGANYAGGPLSEVGSRSTTARAAPPGTPWR